MNIVFFDGYWFELVNLDPDNERFGLPKTGGKGKMIAAPQIGDHIYHTVCDDFWMRDLIRRRLKSQWIPRLSCEYYEIIRILREDEVENAEINRDILNQHGIKSGTRNLY